MIRATNLVRKFGETVALDAVSFHVAEGQIVGFLGPNGAGKTTTLRILTCFMPATSGSASVAGYDVHDRSLAVRRSIGYLPENVPLYGEMRVREYLDYRARLKGMHARRERRRHIVELMDRCWIADVARKLCGRLSKGYRQRVGLAEALIGDPKVLFLDEPTIGLDPNQVRETRRLIKDLSVNHTVMISTHVLPEAEMMCDHIMIIHRGRLAASGTPDALRRRHAAGNLLTLTSRGPRDRIERTLGEIAGVVSVGRRAEDAESVYRITAAEGADVREAISTGLVEAGIPVLSLERPEASLEEVFVNITVREEDAS